MNRFKLTLLLMTTFVVFVVLRTRPDSTLIAQTGTRPTITASEPVGASSGATALSSAGTSTLAATPFQISATPGNLYGVDYTNASASVCYIQLYDALAVNVQAGTSTPIDWIGMGGTTTNTRSVGDLILDKYATGLSATSTTTPTGATPCGTVSIARFRYKN